MIRRLSLSLSLSLIRTYTRARAYAHTSIRNCDHACTRSPIRTSFRSSLLSPKRLEMSSAHFSLFLLGIDNLRQIVIITCSPFAPLVMARTLNFHGSQRAIGEMRDCLVSLLSLPFSFPLLRRSSLITRIHSYGVRRRLR